MLLPVLKPLFQINGRPFTPLGPGPDPIQGLSQYHVILAYVLVLSIACELKSSRNPNFPRTLKKFSISLASFSEEKELIDPRIKYLYNMFPANLAVIYNHVSTKKLYSSPSPHTLS